MATLPKVMGQKNPYAENGQRTPKELAYKAYVVAQEQGLIVEAWLPESIGLDVNAEYQAPYAQGLGQANAKVGELARFLGVSLTTQALTAQIWQGSGEFVFTLPFVFQAESSGADVMLNIKRLLSLTMPDGGSGGLLEAPGPRLDLRKMSIGGVRPTSVGTMIDGLSNALTSIGDSNSIPQGVNNVARELNSALINSVTNNISLYIGQFFYLPSVVITDVSPTFDVVLAQDKNPIRATVNVNFKSFFVPTKQDMEDMFPGVAGISLQNAGGIGGS